MPKAYWIGLVDVTNPDAYQQYMRENAVPFAKYGARFLVRGGRGEQVEGQGRARRVIIEFPDDDTALACYHSPEYAKAKALRDDAGTPDIVVVEGYAGPQPQSPAQP